MAIRAKKKKKTQQYPTISTPRATPQPRSPFQVEFPDTVDNDFIAEFEALFPRGPAEELTGEEETVTMTPYVEEKGQRERERDIYHEDERMETDDQPAGCRQS